MVNIFICRAHRRRRYCRVRGRGLGMLRSWRRTRVRAAEQRRVTIRRVTRQHAVTWQHAVSCEETRGQEQVRDAVPAGPRLPDPGAQLRRRQLPQLRHARHGAPPTRGHAHRHARTLPPARAQRHAAHADPETRVRQRRRA